MLSLHRYCWRHGLIALILGLVIIGLFLEGFARLGEKILCYHEYYVPDGISPLYGVGESTMAGETYGPKMEVARLVRISFHNLIRGQPIASINVARAGESVFPQTVRLESALSCRNKGRPGFVLIYTGNNDASYYHPNPITMGDRIRENLFYRSRLLELILFAVEEWCPPLRLRNIRQYDYNLQRMIEVALANGLTPVLSTVGSNRVDMDPGIPLQDGFESEQIKEIIARGAALEGAGQYRKAIEYYLALSNQNSSVHSYASYRAGKCYQAIGEYKTAEKYFDRTINNPISDNFGRATDDQNDFIRSLARDYSIPVVDAVQIFQEKSPHGLTGYDLFSDGQHPNGEGFALLADGYAKAIAGTLRIPVPHLYSGSEDVLNSAEITVDDRVNSLLSSARWLFSVSANHHYPLDRLKRAQLYFTEASQLDPVHSFSAWMGLGLIDAALNGDFMSKKENIDFLSRHNLFYGSQYSMPRREFSEVLEKFQGWRVSPDIIRHIRATYTEYP